MTLFLLKTPMIFCKCVVLPLSDGVTAVLPLTFLHLLLCFWEGSVITRYGFLGTLLMPEHVVEVSLIQRKRFPANLTDEWLLFTMNAQCVSCEGALLSKSLPARQTHKWSDSAMALLVFIERALFVEALFAEGTEEAWFPVLMHAPLVLADRLPDAKAPPTDLALEWFQPRMLPLVIVQGALRPKSPRAESAAINSIYVMGSNMIQEAVFVHEYPRADFAFVFPHSFVYLFLMLIRHFLQEVSLGAEATLERSGLYVVISCLAKHVFGSFRLLFFFLTTRAIFFFFFNDFFRGSVPLA